VHSAVFFGEEASVGYLLYAGLRKQQGRAVAVAAGAIVAESVLYFANGRHCPLSRLAEELGADHVSVTDIYLPSWIAMRIFTYNAPLVALAALLHARMFLSAHRTNRVWARDTECFGWERPVMTPIAKARDLQPPGTTKVPRLAA
jgi:hypothetical protein